MSKNNTILNESIFYKEVEILNITGKVKVREEENVVEPILMCLKILEYYGEISASFLSDNYGLEIQVANRLLDIMAKQFKDIIEVNTKDNNKYYSSINSKITSKSKLIINEYEKFTSYCLCTNPILFIDLPYIKDLNEALKSENHFIEIFNTIRKLNNCFSNESEKRILSIPPTNSIQNFLYELQFNGFVVGKIRIVNSKYILNIAGNPYEINGNHPSNNELNIELNKLVGSIEDIKSVIKSEIKSEYPDFYIQEIKYFPNDKIKVIIKESNSLNLGKLLNLFEKYNNTINNFHLNNNWFAEVNTIIEITHEPLQNLVIFFIELLNKLKFDFNLILEKNNDELLDFINDLWNENFDSKKFKWDLVYFKKKIQFLVEEECNQYFNHLYSKLMESVIFEY